MTQSFRGNEDEEIAITLEAPLEGDPTQRGRMLLQLNFRTHGVEQQSYW